MLGGEHSITLGAVRAVRKRYPKLSVLHLDAHADMRAVLPGNSVQPCLYRQEDEGALPGGTGRHPEHECRGGRLYPEADACRVFSAAAIRKDRTWVSKVLRHLSRDVYISVDLDAFDPSVMPATGTPEPGGMLWHDVLDVIREVCRKRRIVGFDIVELAPIPGYGGPGLPGGQACL